MGLLTAAIDWALPHIGVRTVAGTFGDKFLTALIVWLVFFFAGYFALRWLQSGEDRRINFVAYPIAWAMAAVTLAGGWTLSKIIITWLLPLVGIDAGDFGNLAAFLIATLVLWIWVSARETSRQNVD
jgi:hypothetical protein